MRPVFVPGSVHSRQAAARRTAWGRGAAGRALGGRVAAGRRAAARGWGRPGEAMAAAVGASHRLPSAARLGVARRNSLRSLRELRSDNRRESEVRSALRAPTPKLRCSAPQTSPRPAVPNPARRPGGPRPRGPRAHGPRPFAPKRCGPLPRAARARCVVYGWTTGPFASSAAMLSGKARARVWGARRRRARAQPRSAVVPARARSALRPSDSPRLFERSERSSRSEFRGGAGAASIAGDPRAAGASTGTPAPGSPCAGARLCPRAEG